MLKGLEKILWTTSTTVLPRTPRKCSISPGDSNVVFLYVCTVERLHFTTCNATLAGQNAQ